MGHFKTALGQETFTAGCTGPPADRRGRSLSCRWALHIASFNLLLSRSAADAQP